MKPDDDCKQYWFGVVVKALASINKVALCKTRLLHGWVTVCQSVECGHINHVYTQPPRSTQPSITLG